MNHETPKSEHLLRLPVVMKLTGLSRPSVYRAISRPVTAGGGFPRPVKLGRASAWPASEVQQWIEQRKEARPRAA